MATESRDMDDGDRTDIPREEMSRMVMRELTPSTRRTTESMVTMADRAVVRRAD
jgi:phosphopantothenate synthetase